MTVDYRVGDALTTIATLPDASVDLVATSPPFLALRNYNNVTGQWGSEATPAEFLDNLLTLTAELRRTLTPHGSIAIELGDTYAGSGGGGGDYHPGGRREGQIAFAGSDAARQTGAEQRRQKARNRTGWPLAKSLCGIPSLFAWSLAYGHNLLNPQHTLEPWRIRNLIVWARNNPPVGALGDKVRPATSYITIATPSPNRWFDLDAIRQPASPNTHPRTLTGIRRQARTGKATAAGRGGNWASLDELDTTGTNAPPLDHWWDHEPTGADGDLVWHINTHGSRLAHYAMWPPALAQRLIRSMCPHEVCTTCGQPRRRLVDVAPSPIPADLRSRNHRHLGAGAVGVRHDQTRVATTVGWSDCGHNTWRAGVVLDPFCGTGTTLAVADIEGRDAIGIDLDPDNKALYEHRYAECWKALDRPGTSPITPHGEQLTLTNTLTTEIGGGG